MTDEIIQEITPLVEQKVIYPYVSLHNYTNFSIFQSLIKPADLFKRAKELGMKAIAVTDAGVCSGLWDAWKESKAAGVKLIVGCTFNFVDDVANKETRLRNLVLIAKNAIGYKNLLTLSKLGYDNFIIARKNPCPRIDWAILEAHKEGLICLTGDTSGIISRLLNDKKFDEAEIQAKRLHDIFGDDLALELQPNGLKRILNNFNEPADQAFTNRQLKKLGEKLGIKMVAATGSYYVTKEQYKAHDTWLALGSGQPVGSGNRLNFDVNDFYIKSGEEVFNFFARTYGGEFAKQLLLTSVALAKKCEKPEWIDPKYSNPSGKELPEFPVKDQEDYAEFKEWLNKQKDHSLSEDVQYLRFKCIKNYKKMIVTNPKYKDMLDVYKSRIYEELDVLENQGFSGYMLIVSDFLEWAKKNGVSVGPGRGCNFFETQVLTQYGFKNLGDINIGEKVFTHTGELNQVINKFEYDVPKEELLEIGTENSYKKLIMTKDHKVFGIKAVETEKYKNAKTLIVKKSIKRFEKNMSSPSWIEAEKLNIGDFIFTQYPNREYTSIPENGDLSNFIDFKYAKDIFIDNDHIKYTLNGNKYCLNRFFDFKDLDMQYLLGRFVGDGWISNINPEKNQFGIAFNIDDKSGIDKISLILKNFGLDVKFRFSKKTKLCQVVVSNKIFVNFIRNIFPNYKQTAITKSFPIFFRDLPDNLLKSLLNGYIDADGCINGNRECIDTISLQLALEMKEALLYLKIPSTINIRKAYIRIIRDSQYNCKQSYKVRFRGLNTEADSKYLRDNGYLSKIINIQNKKIEKVYDISVLKNPSYLTSNGVIHNSAGGSLVAYLLGIHIADPIKYGLVFARFHSKLKVSAPDIDSDLSTSGRYKVEQYINQKYGTNHVAHISNFNMMTPKPYVKAIARTFMFGGDRKEAVRIGMMLADTIPNEAKTVANVFENAPLLNEYAKKYKELAEYSKEFGKNPIAISTHAAGIVIAKRELSGLIPLRRDRDSVISLEFEKERAEENGMIKMDLLGLSTLDIIDETYNLIKQNGKTIPYENFDYESYDKETYDLISRGDTFCVFQFGTSGGTIDLCKRYFPKTIEDLAIITTLARPAAKEIRDDFFKVKNGEKQVELLHPLLERAFKQTLGFPLYDESLLILAEDVAGWDLNEADKLRKLTKEKGKNPAKAKKWKEEFIANSIERKGLKEAVAEEIWEEIITPFGKYSFNKSHAVLYSMISYHTAYLKAHYPIEFLVANLMQEVNSGAKIAKDNISKIKEEIRKNKINIVPPDINSSNAVYTIINELTIATGLDSLKYMGSDAIPEILEKRPFKSFEDFLTRTDASKVKAPAIQALAASGALDSFKMPRKQMFLYAADYKKKLQVWLKKKPEKRGEFSYPWPDEGEWTISEIHALEQFYIGEGLTGSKFEVYPGFFTKNHIHFDTFPNLLPQPPADMSEKDLKNYTRKVNNIQGVVKSVFEFKVKKEKSKIFGQTMAKVTLEDPYGVQVNVTFFPEKWEYLHERIKDRNAKLKFEIGMALSIIGNVQWFDGNISIIFDELQEAKGAPQTPPKLELKSKKTVSERKKKIDDIADEDMDRQELLDEIEEELVENGFADLDDENDEENAWSDT